MWATRQMWAARHWRFTISLEAFPVALAFIGSYQLVAR
jgi:hypothetical protein